MSNDPYADRRSLTFAQAEGADPLPQQLQLRVISKEMRVWLWRIIDDSLLTCKGQRYNRYVVVDIWEEILYDFWSFHLHRFACFDRYFEPAEKFVKNIFENGTYVEVFDFLQFVLRHQSCPFDFDRVIDHVLCNTRAAYRVLDKDTIVPIGSEDEAEALQRAFAELAEAEFHGARSHLRTAGSQLTAGDNAASVRESISSVESVARKLGSSQKLAGALQQLEKTSRIHPSLKEGFKKIYGYTSDEKGIRHPLLDDAQAEVDEADALFMMGACAAFVSYMINKARLAGLLDRIGAAS